MYKDVDVNCNGRKVVNKILMPGLVVIIIMFGLLFVLKLFDILYRPNKQLSSTKQLTTGKI